MFMIYLALGIALTCYVFNDSWKRGMNMWGWSILTFFTGVIGFVIYMLCRKELVADRLKREEDQKKVVEDEQNMAQSKDLWVAKRMKTLMDEGKEGLEAKAIAEMEYTLETNK